MIVEGSALLVGLGIAGTVVGWKRRRVHRRLASVETVPVADVEPAERVEVEGATRPAGEPIEAPVSGREGVLVAWKIDEYDERGDSSYWRGIAAGIESPPFVVDDGTGTVHVDGVSEREVKGTMTQRTDAGESEAVRIDDVLVQFETLPVREELAPGADEPDRIRRFEDDIDLYGGPPGENLIDLGTEHGTRRYYEAVVEPGDEVFVHGAAETGGVADNAADARPDGDGDCVVTEPDDGPLILSDMNGERIEQTFGSGYRAALYGGLSATLVGSGLLANALGVL